MSIAATAWIVLAGVVLLAIVVTFFLMIPELRRYLRIRNM